MKVAVHSGRFHADDVFAVAALRLAGVLTELIRTREPAQLASCDLRVDVGRRYNPQAGDFDHHQPGGAGVRPNGVPYASFGLIWKEYGAPVAGSSEAAAIVDAELVQLIDADDCGYDLFTAKLPGLRPLTVSRMIAQLNPSWQTDPDEAAMDTSFMQAVAFAAPVLQQAITQAREQLAGEALVRTAIRQADDPRIIMLDRAAPWKQTVVTGAPQALYVLHPVWPAVRQQWEVSAVPKQLGSFEDRCPLPLAWAGKAGAELAAVSGVTDAVFCHTGRFMAIAESKAGAEQLARRALISA
ncbi:MAG TPA: MYG1 family protein [Candidatus Saccharimonadales bacterium]|nr:MYG1 family protein [Candidatus Saccharimonadales bacterium]